MANAPSVLVAGLAILFLDQAALADEPTDDWSGLSFGFSLATPREGNSWRQASDGLELEPGPWSGSAMVLSLAREWQRDMLTYGAQLSYGRGEYLATPGDAEFINCVDCATEASDLITLTGRIGLAARSTHLFATGGLAHGNVTATYFGGQQVFEHTDMTGWTIGIGVEQRIGGNLSLALSYDHVDLGTLALPDYLPTGETEVGFDRMQVGMTVHW